MLPAYDMDARVTAPQITAYFAARGKTITRQAIYRWRALGHIREIDRPDGHPRYRFGDVLTAESRTAANPQSSRHNPMRVRDKVAA